MEDDFISENSYIIQNNLTEIIQCENLRSSIQNHHIMYTNVPKNHRTYVHTYRTRAYVRVRMYDIIYNIQGAKFHMDNGAVHNVLNIKEMI